MGPPTGQDDMRLLTWHCGSAIAALLLWVTTASALAGDQDPAPLLAQLKTAGPMNEGQKEARAAWVKLAAADPRRLPEVLAGLDNAGPLASNWIPSAVDAIVERAEAGKTPLPRADIERFLFDTSHAPRARRLAYEILLRGDPALADRVLPKMLDDPSLELRRDAVARVIAEADRLAAAQPLDQPRTVAAYRKALEGARDVDQVNRVAERLRHFGEKVDLPRHFGFITAWHVIGPFDNREKKGFAVAYPPEREIDFAAAAPGKNGEVKWQTFTSTDDFGQVDLNRAVGKNMGAVAYAAAEFESDRVRPVELRLATENACKLWLNGKLLFESEVYHSSTGIDQFVARGEMKAGRNLILVKVCQNEQTEEWAQVWQFQLRVCDAIGKPILSQNRAVAAGGGR
jgi:hypothetical protein